MRKTEDTEKDESSLSSLIVMFERWETVFAKAIYKERDGTGYMDPLSGNLMHRDTRDIEYVNERSTDSEPEIQPEVVLRIHARRNPAILPKKSTQPVPKIGIRVRRERRGNKPLYPEIYRCSYCIVVVPGLKQFTGEAREFIPGGGFYATNCHSCS